MFYGGVERHTARNGVPCFLDASPHGGMDRDVRIPFLVVYDARSAVEGPQGVGGGRVHPRSMAQSG